MLFRVEVGEEIFFCLPHGGSQRTFYRQEKGAEVHAFEALILWRRIASIQHIYKRIFYATIGSLVCVFVNFAGLSSRWGCKKLMKNDIHCEDSKRTSRRRSGVVTFKSRGVIVDSHIEMFCGRLHTKALLGEITALFFLLHLF